MIATDPTLDEPVPSSEWSGEIRRIVRWLSWGSLLPVVGWAYGVAGLWASPRFTRADKVLGSLLFPGGWFGAFVASWWLARASSGYCYDAAGGRVGTESVRESGCVQLGPLPGWLGLVLTLAVLVAAAIGPVMVRSRGLRRAV